MKFMKDVVSEGVNEELSVFSSFSDAREKYAIASLLLSSDWNDAGRRERNRLWHMVCIFTFTREFIFVT